MMELGYAAAALGWERIIAILNKGGGWSELDLPFDLRHRRITTYELTPDHRGQSVNYVREQLVSDVADAIKGVVRVTR